MDSFSPSDSSASLLLARSGDVHGTGDQRPLAYKFVGISLAVASGLFIGTSFVLKKTGLLKANIKYNEEAGEGYGYLKNAYWWTGMTLMIIGEICNFVAYAFVDAILVTPLGALSVVVTTILSAIFLKERLSFVGKVGCFNCIVGSIVIVLNAPEQSSAANIEEMKHFVIAPGFLVYAGLIILGSVFIALWVAPRYGKKSMLVYLTICSLIGGLSVVSTQGLGAAIVAQAGGKPQFNQWFLYVLLVFVVTTLITEIIYLNKALNLFNAALVTPTYYVYFTSATIVTSAILFQGFKGTPMTIITVVMGFLVICSGVVLLQLSKSAKEVPDTAVLKGDLDQVRTVAEQEEPESEPKADAIRGTAAIIRRISNARQNMEAKEARRVHEDRMKDQMEVIKEDEHVEWDGLRRRKTTISSGASGSLRRQKTIHPPLGMTHFPSGPPSPTTSEEGEEHLRSTDVHGNNLFHGGFFNSFRRHVTPRKDSLPAHTRTVHAAQPKPQSLAHLPQRPLTEIVVPTGKLESEDSPYHQSASFSPTAESLELAPRSPTSTNRPHRPIQWATNLTPPPTASSLKSSDSLAPPPPTPPPHGENPGNTRPVRHPNKRQFSWQNPFSRQRSHSGATDGPSDNRGSDSDVLPRSRMLNSRGSEYGIKVVGGTEEERAGLVKGDSRIDDLPSSPAPGARGAFIEEPDEYEEIEKGDLDQKSAGSSGSRTASGTGSEGAHDWEKVRSYGDQGGGPRRGPGGFL